MPYECRDNEDSYLENLGTLKTIIDELDCTCISVVGDWNSDISDGAYLFGNHVRLFCSENNLILSCETHLPGGTFTHYSETWHITSWLDHCISTSDGNEIINSICIYYSINNADHLPMCIDLALQRILEIEVDNNARHRGIAWDKNNYDDRTKYCDISDANLHRIAIPHDALRCSDANNCTKGSFTIIDIYESVHSVR